MEDWSTSAYLICYVIILILTWILNILLIVGIYQSCQLSLCRKNRKSTTFNSNSRRQYALIANYYFITSISLANVISVSFNPPSFIMLKWFRIQNTEISSFLCLIHSSMNTFLCNLTFLHVLCSSLDTFLRLRNPRLYIDSQRFQTTFLKISAPWIVTSIQSACQLTINNQNAIIIKNYLCLLNDGNFLILRSVISYAVPLIVCVILIVLQIIYLRLLTSINITNLQYLIKSYSNCKRYKLNPEENTAEENDMMTQSCPISNEMDGNNSQNEESNPILSSRNNIQESSRILEHNCPKHGLISFPICLDEQAVTSTSLIRDTFESTLRKSHSFDMPDVTNQTKSTNIPLQTFNTLRESGMSIHKKVWLKMYKMEQLSIAINMVMCIISIGVWSPLILSTLAYKLCEESPCTIHILVDRIHDFEWWAFAGGLIYPCSFILIDSKIRRSLRKFLCSRNSI